MALSAWGQAASSGAHVVFGTSGLVLAVLAIGASAGCAREVGPALQVETAVSSAPATPAKMWAAALEAPGIVRERVTFSAPEGTVRGLLARPAGPGPHPAAIVVPGSWLLEPYIASTVAMLAAEGFAALAVDAFPYFPQVETYAETESVPWEVTQQAIARHSTDARVADDLAAGWRFLEAQTTTRRGGVGVIGFCGGGRDALVFAAANPAVAAVVVFYAPVRLELSNRRMLIDVVPDVSVPVQGHYGLADHGIPLEHVAELERHLAARGVPVEIFRYETGHGFFAHNRDESFAEEAARAAWGRAVPFLRAHLE